MNPTPVKRTDYTDVPPYGTYEYRVTASPLPDRRESRAIVRAVSATFKDLVPPPPPASVTALVETKVVRLVWDAVDVPDLAGYKVYRAEAAGRSTSRPVLPSSRRTLATSRFWRASSTSTR